MTATAPGERGEAPYAGPPPTLRPSPELRLERPPPPEDAEVEEPTGPTPYLLGMRSASWAWWRPLAGGLLIAFLLGLALVVTRIVHVLTGVDADLDPAGFSWRGLLVTNLLLTAALPAVLLAWPVFHGVGPGRGLSVAGRFRWPLLGRASLLALATAGAGLALGCAGAVVLVDRAVDGPVPSVPWVLVVGLLTVPLRVAAEEFLFRGYLSQAVAGWIGRPRAGALVAAAVSALLGAALYGTDDAAGFLGRVALGLAASAAVALTGGLEAAVALHVIWALVVLVLGAGLGADAVPGLAVGGPGQAFVLLGVAGLGAFVGVIAGRGARDRGGSTGSAARQVSSSAAP